MGHFVELPKFMPPKLSGDLSAVDHHHLCVFLLAWIADAIALPHLKCAIRQKGIISLATPETVRDIFMNSVVRLKTTDELFQLGGDRLPSWVTTPTYAVMVPDAAKQMPDPFGEPEIFSDHIDLASLAGSQTPLTLTGPDLYRGISLSPDENTVSLQSYQQVQTECNKLHKQLEDRSQHISQLECDIIKWKNKAQAASQKAVPSFASFASHIPSFILLHKKIQEWKGPSPDKVLSFLEKHFPPHITPLPPQHKYYLALLPIMILYSVATGTINSFQSVAEALDREKP